MIVCGSLCAAVALAAAGCGVRLPSPPSSCIASSSSTSSSSTSSSVVPSAIASRPSSASKYSVASSSSSSSSSLSSVGSSEYSLSVFASYKIFCISFLCTTDKPALHDTCAASPRIRRHRYRRSCWCRCPPTRAFPDPRPASWPLSVEAIDVEAKDAGKVSVILPVVVCPAIDDARGWTGDCGDKLQPCEPAMPVWFGDENEYDKHLLARCSALYGTHRATSLHGTTGIRAFH